MHIAHMFNSSRLLSYSYNYAYIVKFYIFWRCLLLLLCQFSDWIYVSYLLKMQISSISIEDVCFCCCTNLAFESIVIPYAYLFRIRMMSNWQCYVKPSQVRTGWNGDSRVPFRVLSCFDEWRRYVAGGTPRSRWFPLVLRSIGWSLIPSSHGRPSGGSLTARNCSGW